MAEGSTSILVRRQRGQRQCVDIGSELFGEDAADEALAGDPALSREGRRDDGDLEMAFAFVARAGMAGMAIGLVDDVEPSRVQPGAQFRVDRLGDAAHRVLPAMVAKRPEADSL